MLQDFSRKLKESIIETQRFLDVARKAQERIKKDESILITGCKETAAVRRASLDLTRSLARLRD